MPTQIRNVLRWKNKQSLHNCHDNSECCRGQDTDVCDWDTTLLQERKVFTFPISTSKKSCIDGVLFEEWVREFDQNTAWKVSKYGVISGPYFPAFGLNTEIYSVILRNQSEYRKIRARNNSVFGHFPHRKFSSEGKSDTSNR